jgi:hypothetical protein
LPKGGKRLGAGVKPRSNEVSRNRSVKFTDNEWETVLQLAKAQNQNRSDYIRSKSLNNITKEEF